MNDIQQIGLMVMLLPMLAMLILLGFALYQLGTAYAAEREARNSRKPNQYMCNKARRI